MSSPRYYTEPQDPRVLAFARVRRASGWILAGSVGAAAVIFGAISHQIPGRSHAPQTTGVATAGSGPTGSTGNTGAGNTGNTGNTGARAVSPPASTQRTPTVVSGGTGF